MHLQSEKDSKAASLFLGCLGQMGLHDFWVTSLSRRSNTKVGSAFLGPMLYHKLFSHWVLSVLDSVRHSPEDVR